MGEGRGDDGSREDGAAMSDRAERLKAALRENLKRRKAQARARTTETKPADSQEAGEPPADPATTPER